MTSDGIVALSLVVIIVWLLTEQAMLRRKIRRLEERVQKLGERAGIAWYD